jgi:hypothetical protein
MGVTAGTYVGTPTLGAAGLLTGDSNTAVTLNGSSQYVQVANVISTPADLSLGVWFTTTYSAANQRLLCLGSAGGTPTGGYVFIGTTGTTLRIGSSIDGVALGVGPAINDGIRHFAVLTRVASSGLLTTYCDGVQIDQRMGTPGTYTWANNGPTIGATFQPLQWLTGTIDEPAVWNRALSAAEIVLLAAVGKGIW